MIFDFSYLNGARVFSFSFGSRIPNPTMTYLFDLNAYQLFDALFVVAAGNEGNSGPASITSPGDSRNVLTVGNSFTSLDGFEAYSTYFWNYNAHLEYFRAELKRQGYPYWQNVTLAQCCPGDNNALCEYFGLGDGCTIPASVGCCAAVNRSGWLEENEVLFNQNNLCKSSGVGPTSDGRIKPDLVAPGTHILSANAQLPNTPCGSIPEDQEILALTGTSMATPIVAGNAALIYQFLISPNSSAIINNPQSINSACIKAAMIVSANPLTGLRVSQGADELIPGLTDFTRLQDLWPWLTPSPYQGFGLIEIASLLDNFFFLDSELISSVQSAAQYCFQIPEITNATVKAALVWTDYPAYPSAKLQLSNNLNLVVQTSQSEFYPNCPPGSKIIDEVNNVELVVIPEAEAGFYGVTITASQLMAAQQYALVFLGPKGTTVGALSECFASS